MKKFILIAVLVVVVAALLVGTALAAGPAAATAQGFGPGNGMRAWNSDQTAQDAVSPCGMAAGAYMRRGMPEWAGVSEEVAALLDMTEEEIQAERQAGKSLAQIAAAKGISEETLIDTIADAHKAHLTQLVTDGQITQAQMDLMVERMQTQIKTMVERTGVGPAFDRQGDQPQAGGMGGMMGRGFRGGRGANR